MRNTTARSDRRVSCQLNGDIVVIEVGTGDTAESLYLTVEEAKQFFGSLDEELMQCCFRVMDQPDSPAEIVVADMALSFAEGWRLMELLPNLIDPLIEFGVRHGRSECCAGVGTRIGRVNWLVEGF